MSPVFPKGHDEFGRRETARPISRVQGRRNQARLRPGAPEMLESLPAAMKPHVRAKNFFVYLLEAARQVRLYFLKQRIIRREHTFRALPALGREPEGGAGAPRLLVVITHVAGKASHHTFSKHEKLGAVLDGVRQSFAHLPHEIVINTLPGRHVVGELPADLTAGVTIHAEDDPDPMLIEFRVQDLFAARREQFDYFLFLEDDVVIQDTLYLDKYALFNRFTRDPKFLLMPNRYEFNGSAKVYIDQNRYSKLAHLDMDGVQLSECANIHSASYLLSRAQLDLWLATGRKLYRQVSYIGPLESAASGCLMEAFHIYKPAPPNLRFLEVRHYDNCYAEVATQRAAQAPAGT